MSNTSGAENAACLLAETALVKPVMPAANRNAQLGARADGANLRIEIGGDWKIQAARPDPQPVFAAIAGQAAGAGIRFDAGNLGEWDSSLVVFVLDCERRAQARKLNIQKDTLPAGLASLIALSESAPEKQPGGPAAPPASFLAWLGKFGLCRWAGAQNFANFLGESVLSLCRLIRREGSFNWRDFWLTMQETSADALPIVGLISFLTGLILAFVGSTQLEKFGATIYVANLVGLGMVREMGALMTGIIMAGRTGAAFAAQLGSMKVNEEIDALRTLAIAPQDFLVTPRLLALFAMMPLLCLYADAIGIAGGGAVGLGLMKLSGVQYLVQTRASVHMMDIGTGLFKSVVFGGIVALTGCMRGMQCGTNASAVGMAATSAVVSGITLIVATDAVCDVIFNILKI
jgi:phospholipid/cholesterol/gamma-HCH transport system permease protein